MRDLRFVLGARTARAVEADRIGDGVAGWWAWGVFLTPLVGLVLLGAIVVGSRDGYVWILREDHPVEWAQFAILVLAVVVALTAAWLAWGRGDRLGWILALVLALAAFVVAGEEISWGQRVFGLVTPQGLSTVNGQHELNFHDIRNGIPLETVINAGEMLVAAAFVPLSWFTRGPSPRLTGQFWRCVTPPLYTLPGFAFMALYRVVRFALTRQFDIFIALKQWAEVGIYLGILAMAFSLLGWQRHQARARHRHTPADAAVAGASTVSVRETVLAVAGVALLTGVFAVLTTWSGVMPG